MWRLTPRWHFMFVHGDDRGSIRAGLARMAPCKDVAASPTNLTASNSLRP